MSSTRDEASSAFPICRGRKGHLYFKGTFVPVEFLWKYLEEGYGIAAFLSSFPSVTQDQVTAVIRAAGEKLAEGFLSGEHSLR